MLFAMAIIVVCLLVSTMFIILCLMIINYFLDGYSTRFPKIKFTQFQKFYSVNPDRWNLDSDYISCYTNKQNYICLRFGFVDYYRYKLWHRNIIKSEFKQKANEQMSEIVAAVKQDIAASEAKAKQMQEEFLNNLKYTYGDASYDDFMKLINGYKKLYEQCQKR